MALAVMILSCAFTRSFAQQLPGRVGIQLSGGSDGGFLLRNEHGAWRFFMPDFRVYVTTPEAVIGRSALAI